MDSCVMVRGLVAGGAAARGGRIRCGDELLAVDSRTVAGLSVAGVATLIAGPVGTEVELTLLRTRRDTTQGRQGSLRIVKDTGIRYTVRLTRSPATASACVEELTARPGPRADGSNLKGATGPPLARLQTARGATAPLPCHADDADHGTKESRRRPTSYALSLRTANATRPIEQHKRPLSAPSCRTCSRPLPAADTGRPLSARGPAVPVSFAPVGEGSHSVRRSPRSTIWT